MEIWSFVPRHGPGIELPLGVRLVSGRAPDTPLRLPEDDNLASRYHAAIEASLLGVRVTDLDSRNGVFVNEERVRSALLRDGDVLRLGASSFRLSRREVDEQPSLPPRMDAAAMLEAFGGTIKADPYVCELCRREGPAPALGHEPWWGEIAWICPACADARRTAPSSWEIPRSPRLGDYELLTLLAIGGMGAVYEARHLHGGMRAAVKVLLPQKALDPSSIKRLVKEQRIVRMLAHPRIVRCVTVGTSDEGQLFVATELLSRGDADALASPRSDLRAVVSVAADMFEALAFAHARGIVHRDVKPSNLLLSTPDVPALPRAKLGDFGLAKSFRDVGGTVITQDGDIGGSAAFLAPEQLLGFREVGPTADVYSAAASLYFLLTGDVPLVLPVPLDEATDTQLCLSTLAEARVPIATRRPDLHPWLAQWIDLLVCRDHARRAHVAAADVEATLRSFLGSG